jgi:general stress protein YciG
MSDQDEVTPVAAAPESAPPLRKRGPKPGTIGAKAGGNAVKQKYGSEYFSQIGKRGGARMRELYGADHYQEIGRKGGQKTRERLGVEHYRRAGKKGGTAKRKDQAGQ